MEWIAPKIYTSVDDETWSDFIEENYNDWIKLQIEEL